MNVTIVEKYNPEWRRWHGQIKAYLGEKVRKICVRIEHVGSTSVPGMTAKPVIDIDLVFKPEHWEELTAALAERGYSHAGDLGIPARESLKFTDEKLERSLPAHHLYACPENSPELKRHIAFREYLKTHKEDRERLSAFKWELAERYNNDRQLYIDGKDALVKEILEKALECYEKANLR